MKGDECVKIDTAHLKKRKKLKDPFVTNIFRKNNTF